MNSVGRVSIVNLGSELRRIIVANNWSIPHIANTVGISVNQVSRYAKTPDGEALELHRKTLGRIVENMPSLGYDVSFDESTQEIHFEQKVIRDASHTSRHTPATTSEHERKKFEIIQRHPEILERLTERQVDQLVRLLLGDVEILEVAAAYAKLVAAQAEEQRERERSDRTAATKTAES